MAVAKGLKMKYQMVHLSSHFVVPDVIQDGSLSVTLGQENLTFVSTIFCFLDEKLKLLKIRRGLVEISPNLQEF